MREDFTQPQYIFVDKGQSPLRIDKFLADRLGNCTRNKLQLAIDEGRIKVDGVPIRANYKVRPLDKISIIYPENRDYNEEILPEEMPLSIIYEDKEVLLVNKPAGLVVHPAQGHYSGTLLNGLAYHFQRQGKDWQDLPRLGLVHRIDKDTSGLLVIGKTLEAIHSLSHQFAAHTIHRRYLALVWGDLAENGTICKRIGRHKRYRQLFDAYDSQSEIGKEAITHYRILENLHYVTLIECRLETGRTHQIRVHMKSIGNPIFGDQTYGGNKIITGTKYPKYESFVHNCLQILPRQALHAQELGFIHPETGEELNFQAPLPNDMQQVLKRWQNYFHNAKSNFRPYK